MGYLPLIIGGIGAMASALLMPWLILTVPFVGQISRSGLHSQDGRLLAVSLGFLALVAAREARHPSATMRSILLVGVITLAAGVWVEYQHMSRLMAAITDDVVEARTGFGVYAMGIGLCCTFAGTVKRWAALRSVGRFAPD
jgi:hypothetical protein